MGAGGRGSWSLLQRHGEKQETVGGGSRGQCQGARHQARPAGRAASGGGAGRGTRGQRVGARPPQPPTLIQGQSYHPLTPTSFSGSLLGTYTVSLPRPTKAHTPTPRPGRIFFFLKGPGGVGWLVVDEVSACTHRGFCLPWRVKPRLSERGPPKPRPSVLHCPPQTWAQGPNLAGWPQPRP